MTSTRQNPAVPTGPTASTEPTIILIPGYWLGSWAWEEVRKILTAAGANVISMTLPGLDAQDPDRATRTLDDQAAAIQDTVDSVDGEVVLVGHSGANGPVSLVLDQHPARIRRVVWVDSGPAAPGAAFAPELPESVTELPLPDFDALGEQASLDGLTDEQLTRFRSNAIPEPGPVVRTPVMLSNDSRLRVPTTLICCSLSSGQIRELAAAGHPVFAEVDRLENVELVDLPTGHWPMFSRPADLAHAIHGASRRRVQN